MKKELPEDDIKYIFTVEFERESEYHLGKKLIVYSYVRDAICKDMLKLALR